MPLVCHTGGVITREALTAKAASRVPDVLPTIRRRSAIREAAGLHQDDLAEVLGVSQATVSRWESGLREPAGENRRRYAEVLETLMAGNV